jgi:hypothetical protein
VLALKPSHAWWHPEAEVGSFQEAASEAGWERAEHPGRWIKVIRTFRDGSAQDWWALELDIRPYGPDKQERVIVATTDPATLPDLTTFYLITNLPAPESPRAQNSELAAAGVAEVVRLYGLRMWVEQSYKQVKHALGWSEYQVRSDQAMRRHWQLVCCAFSDLVVSSGSHSCGRTTYRFRSTSTHHATRFGRARWRAKSREKKRSPQHQNDHR